MVLLHLSKLIFFLLITFRVSSFFTNFCEKETRLHFFNEVRIEQIVNQKNNLELFSRERPTDYSSKKRCHQRIFLQVQKYPESSRKEKKKTIHQSTDKFNRFSHLQNYFYSLSLGVLGSFILPNAIQNNNELKFFKNNNKDFLGKSGSQAKYNMMKVNAAAPSIENSKQLPSFLRLNVENTDENFALEYPSTWYISKRGESSGGSQGKKKATPYVATKFPNLQTQTSTDAPGTVGKTLFVMTDLVSGASATVSSIDINGLLKEAQFETGITSYQSISDILKPQVLAYYLTLEKEGRFNLNNNKKDPLSFDIFLTGNERKDKDKLKAILHTNDRNRSPSTENNNIEESNLNRNNNSNRNDYIADNKLLTFDTINLVKAVGKDDVLDKNGMFLATIKTRFTKVKVFLRGNKLITLWVSALTEDWGNDRFASDKDTAIGIDTSGFQRTAEEEKSLQQNVDRLFVSSKNSNSNGESPPSQIILNRILDSFQVD